MSLPQGEAFALLDGGELYKIRVPLMEDGAGSAPLSARRGQGRIASGERR